MKKENMKLKLIPALVFLLPLCLSASTQGAGFDCSKATSKIEKMICADAELSKLDGELAEVYKTALQNEKQSYTVRQEQKQWLKERNGCIDATCVKQAYELRLKTLSTLAAMPVPPERKASKKEDSAKPAAKDPFYGFCEDVLGPGSCAFLTGKGYTVCEKYLKYLNSLPETPKCEVPIPPGFKEPVWEEVDYMQHLDWAHKISGGLLSYVPTGLKPIPFEEWKPLFLKYVAEGLLSPQMRKTKVNPLGGKEVTLIAFTEDKLACRRPLDGKPTRYNTHTGLGYFYHLLTDDPAEPVRDFGIGLYSASYFRESVLLLYAGKPYFVRPISLPLYAQPFELDFDILDFEPSPMSTIPEQNIYRTRKICDFVLSCSKYPPPKKPIQ